TNSNGVIDQGSLAATDPYAQVIFTHPGEYIITVGSYLDYDDNPYFLDDPNAGVFQGTSYDLNMTVQRHGTNEDAINLVGKTMTVVDGTGTGRSATVVAYDAKTNVYTLDTQFTGAPLDTTSALQFTYSVPKEFTNYSPTDQA